MSRLHAVTFGDPDAGLTGVVLGGAEPFACVLSAADGTVLDGVQLASDGIEAPWSLTGPELELQCIGVGDATGGQDGTTLQQLCHVHGRLPGGGELDCPGHRALIESHALERLESLRGVSALFGSEDAVAVLARRPAKAKSHADDALDAAVFDPAGNPPVVESRLSSTYDGAGHPLRAGLELWLGDPEGEQYSRRVAGEATGARANGELSGVEGVAAAAVEVSAMRCHSRGRDGAGAYVLVRWR